MRLYLRLYNIVVKVRNDGQVILMKFAAGFGFVEGPYTGPGLDSSVSLYLNLLGQDENKNGFDAIERIIRAKL